MREIKFRAFDKLSNYMFVPSIVSFEYNLCYENRGIDISNKPLKRLHMLKNIILMQYTGLKDKNDKEIYEGDILKIYDDNDKSICKVVFDNGAFRREYMKWDKSLVMPLLCDSLELWKIIGNIYENPELLKERL